MVAYMELCVKKKVAIMELFIRREEEYRSEIGSYIEEKARDLRASILISPSPIYGRGSG